MMDTGTATWPDADVPPNHDFVPGNIVRLKSGGPKMTVCEVNRQVHCVWFHVDDVFTRWFPPEVIEKCPPPGEGMQTDVTAAG